MEKCVNIGWYATFLHSYISKLYSILFLCEKILFHKLDFQSAVEKWRYSHLNVHQTIKWQNISSFLLMPIKYTALCNIAVHINHQPFFVIVDWNQRKNKFILNHLHLFTRNMNRYILGITRNINRYIYIGRYILGITRNMNRYWNWCWMVLCWLFLFGKIYKWIVYLKPHYLKL